MTNSSVNAIFLQRDHVILLRGLFYMFLASLPIVGFVGIMGAGAPNSPGFIYSIGVILGMMLAGTLGFVVLFKIIDSLLSRSLALRTFSYFSVVMGTLFFTGFFNVFVDNLFQIKQGNYDVVVMEFLGACGFWAIVIASGHIRLGKKKTEAENPPPSN